MNRFSALLAPLLLCGLAPQSAPTADGNSEHSNPTSSYVIQCEVWDATDPQLVRKLEAQAPTDAVTILASLRNAESGTQRLMRVLSPIDLGAQARFASEHETPTVQITASGGGRTQENFGGYTSEGTTVTLACTKGPAAGLVKTSLDLEISGFQDEAGKESPPGIPPSRRTVEVHCGATSASGELRVLQFQTSEPGTLFVFFRATAF